MSAKHLNQLVALASQFQWLQGFVILLLPIFGFTQIPFTPLRTPTLICSVALYWITGLAITAGYHRYWSHRSYSATMQLQYAMAAAGAGALQGSIGFWASRHRTHHRFTDTDLDPYGVNQGFWHCHMGWLLWKKPKVQAAKVDVSDLHKDPVVQWQHRNLVALGLINGIIIPVLVPGLFWNDWRGGLVYAFIMRMFAFHQTAFFVNSLAHSLGHHTFEDRHTPRDHPLTALLSMGEGYHNFHHTFPSDYRNGVKWYQYDPMKWAICVCYKLGLVYDLKTFPPHEVDRSRLQQEQKVLIRKQVDVDKRLEAIDIAIPLEQLPIMEWEDYVTASKQGRKLVVIAGIVHDVAQFSSVHPGGQAMIAAAVGKDATAMFSGGVYAHGRVAKNILAGLRVAVIRGGGEVEVWKSVKSVEMVVS